MKLVGLVKASNLMRFLFNKYVKNWHRFVLKVFLVVPTNISWARFVRPQLERSNSDGGVVALAAPAPSAQRDPVVHRPV